MIYVIVFTLLFLISIIAIFLWKQNIKIYYYYWFFKIFSSNRKVLFLLDPISKNINNFNIKIFSKKKYSSKLNSFFIFFFNQNPIFKTFFSNIYQSINQFTKKKIFSKYEIIFTNIPKLLKYKFEKIKYEFNLYKVDKNSYFILELKWTTFLKPKNFWTYFYSRKLKLDKKNLNAISNYYSYFSFSVWKNNLLKDLIFFQFLEYLKSQFNLSLFQNQNLFIFEYKNDSLTKIIKHQKLVLSHFYKIVEKYKLKAFIQSLTYYTNHKDQHFKSKKMMFNFFIQANDEAIQKNIKLYDIKNSPIQLSNYFVKSKIGWNLEQIKKNHLKFLFLDNVFNLKGIQRSRWFLNFIIPKENCLNKWYWEYEINLDNFKNYALTNFINSDFFKNSKKIAILPISFNYLIKNVKHYQKINKQVIFFITFLHLWDFMFNYSMMQKIVKKYNLDIILSYRIFSSLPLVYYYNLPLYGLFINQKMLSDVNLLDSNISIGLMAKANFFNQNNIKIIFEKLPIETQVFDYNTIDNIYYLKQATNRIEKSKWSY